ncbi:MAG: hypothetical protein KBA75_09845 [Alphaproteobacteria bacterium]|nr:hypothetical protein [Alphaproteobacteria bacterium]
MDQATIWLSLLMMVVMTIVVAPPVLRMNQGKIIRNAAIWVAIVVGLALFYNVFGPFKMASNSLPVTYPEKDKAGERTDDRQRPKLDDSNDTEVGRKPAESGYTPPNE